MSFVGLIFEYLTSQGFLLALAALVVFIYVLSTFLQKERPGPNPFTKDERRSPDPLVTDLSARDKVLKQGFLPKKVPDNLDAIVIGSGIGGLGAAALLAKAGQKVLVLEQHDQAGGCCHTYIEKGYEFDVGVHYIGGMRHDTSARFLVEQITEGQLQWCHLVSEFDRIAIGPPGKQKFYPFRSGSYESWKAGMLEKFPKEEAALNKYIQLLRTVRRNMAGQMLSKVLPKWVIQILVNLRLVSRFTKYFEYGRRSVDEVLDDLTDNKELKAVLAYSFGDYGTVPRHGSFAMHATLINHYMQGASYPRGGASEIAFTIIPVIEKAGGRVLVRAKVAGILTEGNRAVGVKVSKSSGDVEIRAPLVISDAGALNTLQRLLPPEVARKSSVYPLLSTHRVKSGVAALSLFVGLKGTAEELNLEPIHTWAFTSNNLSEISLDYMAKPLEDATDSDIPLLFLTFPSAKDPTFNERFPGRTACTVITLASWAWFERWAGGRVMKRGEDYEAMKAAIGRRLWSQVLALYPQLEDKVDYFEVGSPVSNNHYLASPKGEIYGLDHTAERFGSPHVVSTLRPNIDIPGLLLTGQDVFSCGVIGALFGGLMCASTALNRNLYKDMMKLHGDLKKAK